MFDGKESYVKYDMFYFKVKNRNKIIGNGLIKEKNDIIQSINLAGIFFIIINNDLQPFLHKLNVNIYKSLDEA